MAVEHQAERQPLAAHRRHVTRETRRPAQRARLRAHLALGRRAQHPPPQRTVDPRERQRLGKRRRLAVLRHKLQQRHRRRRRREIVAREPGAFLENHLALAQSVLAEKLAQRAHRERLRPRRRRRLRRASGLAHVGENQIGVLVLRNLHQVLHHFPQRRRLHLADPNRARRRLFRPAHAPRRARHGDARALQRRLEARRKPRLRSLHRRLGQLRFPAERQLAENPDRGLPGEAQDRELPRAARRDRHGAVVELELAVRLHHLDQARRPQRRARGHTEIDIVVVERDRRNLRAVILVEIFGRPAGAIRRAAKKRGVRHDVAGNPPHPGALQHRDERGEDRRKLAAAPPRIPARVAPAAHDHVAREVARRIDRRRGEDRGADARVAAQRIERERAGVELGIRGRAQPQVGPVFVKRAPGVERHHLDAPERTLESRLRDVPLDQRTQFRERRHRGRRRDRHAGRRRVRRPRHQAERQRHSHPADGPSAR